MFAADNKIETKKVLENDKLSIEKKLQESFTYEPGKSPNSKPRKSVLLNE